MITLKHGTDYTKIPLSLCTKSGKIHTYDPDLALKDMDFSKTIIVNQQWNPEGYSITNVDDQYLSLKNYNSIFSHDSYASYSKVEEFRKSRAAKQNYLGTAYLGSRLSRTTISKSVSIAMVPVFFCTKSTIKFLLFTI